MRPLKPTNITIQVADRNILIPQGVIENVLVNVNDFIYPVDFYVIDLNPDLPSCQTDVLLGRPFLRTAKAKIDFLEWSITLEFLGNVAKFNMTEIFPSDQSCVNFIDVLDSTIKEVRNLDTKDPLEVVLCSSLTQNKLTALEDVSGRQKRLTGQLHALEKSKPYLSGNFIPLKKDSIPDKLPSILQAPELELKPLPVNLKYAYIGKDETLPVIISSKLTNEEEERLVQLLRVNKKAIGWTLADIPGISPSICTHKIHTEADKKPVRQPQ